MKRLFLFLFFLGSISAMYHHPADHYPLVKVMHKPKTFNDLRINQGIFSKHVGLLLTFIYTSGYSCSLGEVYRTPQQAALNAKEHKGIFHSQHCLRLAIDIDLFSPLGLYLIDSKDYEFLGRYWKSLDAANRWGGDFGHGCAKADGNHFERQEV